jgi:hypothetical protein
VPAITKQRGDIAELAVAADLVAKGYRVAIPFGEDCDYDLILDRAGSLERIQVKYGESKGVRLEINCRSHSLTNGKIRRTKRYTSVTIEWLAVFDSTTRECFYIPSSELGERGRACITLRLRPARNNQRAGLRLAAHYRNLEGSTDG